MSTERIPPCPAPTPESLPFWEAAKRGELLIKHCLDCARAHWYPRMRCPFCASDRTDWKPSPGLGTIYSYSPMLRASPPFVLAYVTLDDGPTVLTNIVGADPASLAIGQRVKVCFQPSDGEYPVPVYTPA